MMSEVIRKSLDLCKSCVKMEKQDADDLALALSLSDKGAPVVASIVGKKAALILIDERFLLCFCVLVCMVSKCLPIR